MYSTKEAGLENSILDLQKVATFLCAAENLSFSGTAKQLHLSQPTVSHQIKTLEQELGSTLFERSGTGLRLTEAGQLLLPRARRLVHDSVSLQAMMSSLQEVVGELRIACSTTAGNYETDWLQYQPAWSASGSMTAGLSALDHQRYKIHGRSITYQFSGTFTLGGTASNFIYGTHLWNPTDSPVAIAANGENTGTVEALVERAVPANFEFQRHSGANWTLP